MRLTTNQLKQIIREAKGPGLQFPITVTVDYTLEWTFPPYEAPIVVAQSESRPDDITYVLSAPGKRGRSNPHPALFKAAKKYASENPPVKGAPEESISITYVVDDIYRDENNWVRVMSQGAKIASLMANYKPSTGSQELIDLAKQWVKENPRRTNAEKLGTQPLTDDAATTRPDGSGGKVYDYGAGVTKKVDKNGTEVWYLRDKIHRDGDKPAVIKPDGTKKWYINGKLHRIPSLPAVEWATGAKDYYTNGKLIKQTGY